MKEGQASRTAEYMALFRALESARPPGERLFCDPLAVRFLRLPLSLLVRLARLPLVRWIALREIDRRGLGSRTSAVARTRVIDDAVAEALAEGVAQVVLLGAGFDARPYRLPALANVRVFEVDHPATGAAKRERLEAALGRLPEHVRFVASDFRERGLREAMAAARFDPSLRTLFLWEGVTNYLDAASVDAALRWFAEAAPGSRAIFTYVDRRVLDDPGAFEGTARLFAALAAVGERWTFGLDPAGLPRFLAERGLALERDLGAAEYRALCWGPAARSLRGYEFYRLAQARVPPRGELAAEVR